MLIAGHWKEGAPSGRCFAQLAPVLASTSRLQFFGDFHKEGDQNLTAVGRMKVRRESRWDPTALEEEDYAGQVLSVWSEEITEVDVRTVSGSVCAFVMLNILFIAGLLSN